MFVKTEKSQEVCILHPHGLNYVYAVSDKPRTYPDKECSSSSGNVSDVIQLKLSEQGLCALDDTQLKRVRLELQAATLQALLARLSNQGLDLLPVLGENVLYMYQVTLPVLSENILNMYHSSSPM